MKHIITATVLCLVATAASASQEYLIKLKADASPAMFRAFSNKPVEKLGGDWYRMEARELSEVEKIRLEQDPKVAYIQPNYELKIMHDFRVKDPELRAQVQRAANNDPNAFKAFADNPDFGSVQTQGVGADPLEKEQWGMKDIGLDRSNSSAKDLIVAVIDTGVDYNHEDLAPNMWKNAGEMGTDSQGRDRSKNGIDDDGNGYVDDLVGWDFVKNDNKPYDLTVGKWQLLLGGGNPGHGTHCAGNVGARFNNKMGIRGVAGEVQIMALRFLSERGGGTTADAVKAIRYAVDNGAKVLSNSWGQEGENPLDAVNNEALKEAIRYANSKGVLFVAAAGNGHMGKGYDNDTDARPAYPASYDIPNIVSVAAIDVEDNLGPFSNWGKNKVHIAAPGVNVFSTVPGTEKYTNKAISLLFGIISATWDGTSMAAPHVAGAAALYWAKFPKKSVAEVKSALIMSAKKTSSLDGKLVSDGKLNVSSLLQYR